MTKGIRVRPREDAPALRSVLRFDEAQAVEFVARGWWREDTLSQWLARHALERPAAPALVHAGAVVSWKALAERVERFAAGLHAAGVSAGDVVAVQLPNIPEFVVASLAWSE